MGGWGELNSELGGQNASRIGLAVRLVSRRALVLFPVFIPLCL